MISRISLVAALAVLFAAAAPTTAQAQTQGTPGPVDVNRQDAPGSYGNFIAALNTQRMHRQRLARINNLTPQEVTVSDVSTIAAPDNTTALDNAITRRASASRTASAAASGNSVVAGVLSSAGINADRVLAITVKGHGLRDVTVFYR